MLSSVKLGVIVALFSSEETLIDKGMQYHSQDSLSIENWKSYFGSVLEWQKLVAGC